MKAISGLCIFAFLLIFRISAFADSTPLCNELLSGLSNEIAVSIRDLAKLRFDLDRRIALGENALVTRTLQKDYRKKEAAVLAASALDIETLLELLKIEISTIQEAILLEENIRQKVKSIERGEVDDAVTRNHLELIGKLQHRRDYPSLTLLPENDRALVMGGLIGGRHTQLVEVIDLQTGKSELLGNLNRPRLALNPAVLSDRKVLIYDLSPKNFIGNVVELFDPKTGTSTDLGMLSEMKEFFAGSVLPDDRVIVTGGSLNKVTLSTIESIDPSSGKIEVLGKLIEKRDFHAQSTLQNGQVLIVAGRHDSKALKSIELFNPLTKISKPFGELQEARSAHAQTLLPDGNVLVSGGDEYGNFRTSIEVIDVNTRTSKIIGHLKIARRSHHQALLTDGRLLVLGGFTQMGKVVQEIELVDLNTGVSEVTTLLDDRTCYAVAFLPDGVVLVGGRRNAVTTDSLDRFKVDRR